MEPFLDAPVCLHDEIMKRFFPYGCSTEASSDGVFSHGLTSIDYEWIPFLWVGHGGTQGGQLQAGSQPAKHGFLRGAPVRQESFHNLAMEAYKD